MRRGLRSGEFRDRLPGHIHVAMGARPTAELLTLPVKNGDVDLGWPVDVFLDRDGRSVLGLEVRCRDEEHRFLPLGAARLGPDAVEVGSALTLLDDLSFYRARGSSVRALRGTPVLRRGRAIGTFGDVLVRDTGAVEALLVDTASGRARVPLAADLELASEAGVSAA